MNQTKEHDLTTFLDTVRGDEVINAATFCKYAQQTIGTPIPLGGREHALLNTKLCEFFAMYPHAGWPALVATTNWCRAEKRRPATAAGIISNVRWAWSAGAVPQMDPTPQLDPRVEFSIDRALEVETDERWRRMLLGACGVENRREVLASWRRK